MKKKALQPSEKQVALAVIQFLRYRGWRVHPLHAEQNFRHAEDRKEERGTPDYICVKSCGSAFYLEVKRPGGKLRESQKLWRDQAIRDGFVVMVSDNIDKFIESYLNTFVGPYA